MFLYISILKTRGDIEGVIKMQLGYKAPCATLTNIENLWFQLSKISCNLKCKHCFLDCFHDTRKRNFLNIEKIAEVLNQQLLNVKTIYLTGGEPLMHPQINEIIKYCLRKANTTICTNGTLLSEKKIKILKEMEQSTNNKLHFKISLDHYTEGRNDEYRGNGVFKKVLKALKNAQKHEIETSIICTNLKNDSIEKLNDGFCNLFERNNLDIKKENIKIIRLLKMGNYAKYYNISTNEETVTFEELKKCNLEALECKSSRVITSDGVYSCPALVNDPRGKLGEDINTASKNVYLETQTCYDCIRRNDRLFG